jgi:hypothetical protein
MEEPRDDDTRVHPRAAMKERSGGRERFIDIYEMLIGLICIRYMGYIGMMCRVVCFHEGYWLGIKISCL